ncbi:hypothetical protein BS47DRAFT_1363382 [Hydnum rufescens UP504]|uniref:Uncharacterized protein n=1 Tax=Hydnum rufescens UP504 TaxID=1448309 RepID=A0A9P6AU96_9AGAM|nr:hypothetical protein BS47DRAFT_1363382 [Hydnum rufescens UP504]
MPPHPLSAPSGPPLNFRASPPIFPVVGNWAESAQQLKVVARLGNSQIRNDYKALVIYHAINEEEKECSIKKTKEAILIWFRWNSSKHGINQKRCEKRNDPDGAPSESASKSSKDPAPLFLSARCSSHIQVYLSLYYNLKIAPLLKKQAALDRASFAAASKKWSKLVMQNKIMAELYAKETDNMIAAVEAEHEWLYQELKAQNSEDANQKAKIHVGTANKGEVSMDYLAHQYPACTGTVLPSYMKFLEAKYKSATTSSAASAAASTLGVSSSSMSQSHFGFTSGSITKSHDFSTNHFGASPNDLFINDSRADHHQGDDNDNADLASTNHMGNDTTVELPTTPHCPSPPKVSTVTPEIERRHHANIVCNATMMAEWEKVAKETGIPNEPSKGKGKRKRHQESTTASSSGVPRKRIKSVSSIGIECRQSECIMGSHTSSIHSPSSSVPPRFSSTAPSSLPMPFSHLSSPQQPDPPLPSANCPNTLSADHPNTPSTGRPGTPNADHPGTPNMDCPGTPHVDRPNTPTTDRPGTPAWIVPIPPPQIVPIPLPWIIPIPPPQIVLIPQVQIILVCPHPVWIILIHPIQIVWGHHFNCLQ